MRTAFVTTGSIERIATGKRAFGLAGPLAALGHEVAILLEDCPANRARLALEAPSARPLWYAPGSAPAQLRAKRRLLAGERPDVVYLCSFGARSLVLPPRAARGALHVVEHSELLSAIANRPPLRRLGDAAMEWASFRLFDGHVAASRYLEAFVTGRVRANGSGPPVLYSPYAYSPAMLATEPALDADLARRFEGRRVILYMGTLARNYGILDIIAAVGRLRRSHPDILLVVLGQGRDGARARREAARAGLDGAVHFAGYVPDAELPSWLARAAAFVAPLYETTQDMARCPSKLFLYLPHGRPVVTSPVGEARALFGGADYPFYYRPGDVGDLAQALARAAGAGPGWSPPWSAGRHDWTCRARELDVWLRRLRDRR